MRRGIRLITPESLLQKSARGTLRIQIPKTARFWGGWVAALLGFYVVGVIATFVQLARVNWNIGGPAYSSAPMAHACSKGSEIFVPVELRAGGSPGYPMLTLDLKTYSAFRYELIRHDPACFSKAQIQLILAKEEGDYVNPSQVTGVVAGSHAFLIKPQ